MPRVARRITETTAMIAMKTSAHALFDNFFFWVIVVIFVISPPLSTILLCLFDSDLPLSQADIFLDLVRGAFVRRPHHDSLLKREYFMLDCDVLVDALLEVEDATHFTAISFPQ